MIVLSLPFLFLSHKPKTYRKKDNQREIINVKLDKLIKKSKKKKKKGSASACTGLMHQWYLKRGEIQFKFRWRIFNCGLLTNPHFFWR